jgi:DNA polymerase I
MAEDADLGPPAGEGPDSELKPRKRVFIVDGNSYLYRAFFATPHLSNAKGVPTNATYSFMNMLKKLSNEEAPDYLVVVFDSKAPSFREEISKAYKAQRPPMPDNLSVQTPYVKSLLKAMGLPVLEKDGYEADDIIATLVDRLKDQDTDLVIVTSDKDMMQLVSDKVIILDTMKGSLIREKDVIEKFGVRPALVADYLALSGDTSDNIPGVPGIGDKTARELVSTLGGLDAIYANLDGIEKTSVREKLRSGRDLAYMSRDLATLRLDVPVETILHNLAPKEQDARALRGLYRELEFLALYRDIKVEQPQDRARPMVTLSQLGRKRIGLLAVFNGRNAADLHVQRFAACDGGGVFYSEKDEDLLEIVLHAEEVIVHDLKPLLILIRKQGGSAPELRTSSSEPVLPAFFDTMLATYLINPLRKDYGIGAVIEEFLDVTVTSHDPKQALADSAPHLFELKELLYGRLEEWGVRDLFSLVEMPLVRVLAAMECTGVKVDRGRLSDLSRDFDKRLNRLMKEIYNLAGGPFNINSPQQLSRVLFETLQLQPVKKTKTGYSTDTEVLQTLSAFHPLPKEILEYRTLSKLKGTYVDVLPTLIDPRTGRIHASFNQMVVATGRLSSSDPNLQNIPVRGEEGMKIRAAFVPEPGFVLMSSDYSQIELRVLAHISQDQRLIDTFMRDEDIHSHVAQEVFGVAPEAVTQEMRRTAKVINFGIIYGMSSYGLSKELGISQREAQQYIDDYFQKYKGVKDYMDGVLEEARREGRVKTLLGRIRSIPEIRNPDANVRQLGERAAMNTPIQGTAADLIKIAMVNIYQRLSEKNLRSLLIMQIHDELVFEVKEEETDIMERIVRDEMEHVTGLSVPLKVSIGKGLSWAEAHG